MPLTAILVAALAVPTLSAVLGWALAAALLVVIVGRFVFSLLQKYNEGEPEGHHIQSLYAVSLGLSFFLLSSVAGIWLSGFNVLLPVPVLVGAFLFYLRMENGDKMPDAGKGNKRPKDFIIHYPLSIKKTYIEVPVLFLLLTLGFGAFAYFSIIKPNELVMPFVDDTFYARIAWLISEHGHEANYPLQELAHFTEQITTLRTPYHYPELYYTAIFCRLSSLPSLWVFCCVVSPMLVALVGTLLYSGFRRHAGVVTCVMLALAGILASRPFLAEGTQFMGQTITAVQAHLGNYHLLYFYGPKLAVGLIAVLMLAELAEEFGSKSYLLWALLPLVSITLLPFWGAFALLGTLFLFKTRCEDRWPTVLAWVGTGLWLVGYYYFFGSKTAQASVVEAPDWVNILMRLPADAAAFGSALGLLTFLVLGLPGLLLAIVGVVVYKKNYGLIAWVLMAIGVLLAASQPFAYANFAAMLFVLAGLGFALYKSYKWVSLLPVALVLTLLTVALSWIPDSHQLITQPAFICKQLGLSMLIVAFLKAVEEQPRFWHAILVVAMVPLAWWGIEGQKKFEQKNRATLSGAGFFRFEQALEEHPPQTGKGILITSLNGLSNPYNAPQALPFQLLDSRIVFTTAAPELLDPQTLAANTKAFALQMPFARFAMKQEAKLPYEQTLEQFMKTTPVDYALVTEGERIPAFLQRYSRRVLPGGTLFILH